MEEHLEFQGAGGEDPTVGLVVGGLADGLTLHDAEGHYVYVSPSFGAMVGSAPDELVGRSPFDGMFHRDDVGRVVEVQDEALETGQPWRLNYRIKRSDGPFVWVESAGRVVDSHRGRRFVVITREAAHLESLVQSLEHEREVKVLLDELAARQQRFLTTVSHRARTPLTSVVGMADVLEHRGEDLDVDQRRALVKRLAANAQRLSALLEDATDADRLTRADVVLQRRVVDVRALVESVLAEVTGGDGTVEVDVEEGLRAVVDRAKVARMLQILLGNAFKHAGVGASVKVSARATDEGIELSVADDGPGVSPRVRDLIFEPFSHADSDAPDPGAGLGLYLVSELAALHRGRVWVDDSPTGGARFRVRLPRPRADAPVAGAPQVGARRPAAAALRPEADRFVTTLLSSLRSRIDMELVYLSVLDDTHQHVLAVAGTADLAGIEPGVRIPLEQTYCARMVTDELAHVVGDTSANPITADLPPTADGLACWIGVPVHLPSGQVLGTLCCADGSPRPDLTQEAADELRSFAAILGDQLAGEGFLDGTALDATGRIADVLTRPDAVHPVFQPIVDLTDGTVSGVEALSRFTDHDRPVDLWFADAARTGLLVDLEVLTARQGLTALDTLPADVYVTINLSPQTVRSRELAALLTGRPLDRIVLEITEHATVDNYKPLVEALAPFRTQGLRVAIDDVGTGYAGLGHLVRLGPDIIKVDRSLVETLDTDPAHAAAVGAIARMADHLDADLVAEGIERPATLDAVRDIGFSHAQGYLLGRPAPTPDIQSTTTHAADLLAGRDRPAVALDSRHDPS